MPWTQFWGVLRRISESPHNVMSPKPWKTAHEHATGQHQLPVTTAQDMYCHYNLYGRLTYVPSPWVHHPNFRSKITYMEGLVIYLQSSGRFEVLPRLQRPGQQRQWRTSREPKPGATPVLQRFRLTRESRLKQKTCPQMAVSQDLPHQTMGG